MTAEQHKLDIAGLFELKGPYSLFCWKDEITNPEPLAGPGAWRAGKMSGYLVLGSPRLLAPEAVQPANCAFGCTRIDLGLDSGQTLVR
jgi:hypothetical protein